MMAPVEDVVFLLDVDNTLLDNDTVTADLRGYMREALGAEHEQRCSAIPSPSGCTRAHSRSSRNFANAARWSSSRTATWSSSPSR